MDIPSILYTLVLALVFAAAHANPIAKATHPSPENVNHIFNAIHSSMRQWGSSLNHNGMSFFMASVPAGTQLYHGSWSSDVVRGMEWLAFEPEHSLFFARPRRRHPPSSAEEDEVAPSCKQEARSNRHDAVVEPAPPAVAHQKPLANPRPQSPNYTADLQGYLHIYVPKRLLKLLYIDGLSAGKTSNGTLDTQDLILLSHLPPPDSPMGGEFHRAHALCDLAATLWQHHIDGILRMEAGFEIILCNFESTLERVDLVSVKGTEGNGEDRGMLGNWRYLQAVADRWHGIGGGRVELQYEEFVSVFAFDEGGALGLWRNEGGSDTPQPRLGNASPGQVRRIKDAVTAMILRSWSGSETEPKKNWQAVADMVVKRYAAPLHHLHTDEKIRSSREASASYLSALLEPFLSASTGRNATLEAERCTRQIVPPLPTSPGLAHRTVHAVLSHICGTLIAALDALNALDDGIPGSTTMTLATVAVPGDSLGDESPQPPQLHGAVSLIDELISYLQWTTWKECGTCSDDEVCVVPIWPMGSLENHRAPRCTGEEEGIPRGYWGEWGRGRDGEAEAWWWWGGRHGEAERGEGC